VPEAVSAVNHSAGYRAKPRQGSARRTDRYRWRCGTYGGVVMTGIGYVVGRIRLPRNPKFTPVRWPTMAELGAVGS